MEYKLLKKLHWLGHDSFRIDAEQTIYIDPYQLPTDSPQADLILITHHHHDHFSPEDLARITGPDTALVSIAAVTREVTGNLHTVNPGDKLTVKGIAIEAVPAYNVDKKFHPKAAGHVGYIITVDGERLYHAGDTDVIPEMSTFETDIALLPVSGTYVMTADEAVEACRRINPRLAIPMHYGAIVGGLSDAQRFADKSPVETLVMEKQ